MHQVVRAVNAHHLLLLFGLLAAAPAPAAETGALEEIVVTAVRREIRVRDLARAVSVVEQERIQQGTQQLGLDESLAAVPGLYMQNRYNFSQDLRISLRGFGARSSFGIRGIKVIVDGIPETLPDGQAQVDSIDLGSARRIEVLRGPASSLYGNASGGVIAIESELGRTPGFVEGGIAAGELGFRRYQLKTGGRNGGVDYLLNVSRREVDGYREHSRSRGSLVNGRLGWQLDADDRLSLAFNHTDQPEAQDPGGIDLAQATAAPRSARDRNLAFDAGEALDQQRVGLVYERQRPAGVLTLRNYYVWRDFANKLPFPDGGQVAFDRFFYGAGLQYDVGDLAPESLELTLGADFDRQQDDRRRFDNLEGARGDLVFEQRERVDGVAVYAQGQYAWNDRWALTAGLRYDRVTFDVADRYLADGDDSGEIDFDQLSPSLGLNIKLAGQVLYAAWSSSFETPTTTELANPDASGGFNTALEPQRADNYELGFRSGSETLFFEVAAFHIELEDELVPFELEASPGRTFFRNAGASRRDGIETAVSWEHASGVGIEASWTFSDFTFDTFVDENGNDFGGRQLPGLPRHFGYLGISWDAAQGFSALFETLYSGELYADNANSTEVDAYAVVNLRMSHEFDRGRWRVRPYLGINNLFNERYHSNIRINAFGARYYEPAPLRNLYAGVEVSFRPGAGQ